MEAFKKVVRIGSFVPSWYKVNKHVHIFCKIEYSEGRLSISGVEGPLPSGNAVGSCGQIDMHLRDKQETITPASDWDRDMLAKFFAVWQEWHLNDMSPMCEHQRAHGWDETAKEKVNLYHWQLKSEILSQQKKLQERSLEALKRGEQVQLDREEQDLLGLPYSTITYRPEPFLTHYEPKHRLDGAGAVETKALGWLRPDEHPRGLLTKPCEVCSYKYGTAWKKREVPEDVLTFLRGLPVCDKKPAWV